MNYKFFLSTLTIFISVVFISPSFTRAENAYLGNSSTITQGTEINDVTYSHTSDNGYWRLLSTASGIDVTVTFDNVNLNSANTIYVNYDGLASSASLTHQIQIRDFTNSTWRNLVPHDTTRANTADSGAGLITQNTAAIMNGTMFPVYDGYFSNGSNTPVSTPVSDYVNGSNQAQIRILYSGSTPNLELRVDYLSIEPAIDTQLYASSMTNTAGGSVTNEYNDTTTDDNTTNLNVTANGSGVDFYLSFTNAPTPYTGANTILVEFSGFRTTITNYSISIRDFTNSQWDTLSATPLTNTADATNHFAISTGQAVTDYISSGEIRVRVSSASTSGSATVDFVRVTIGSYSTNTGFYVGTLTRGTTSSGTLTNTQTLDTSGAVSGWVIATNTADARTTVEFAGDCGTATNSCTAGNIQFPVTLPSNVMTTAIHTAFRYSTSVATTDYEFGIRSKKSGNVALTTAVVDETSAHMMIRTAAFPMPAQVGNDPIATIPVYAPHEYVNTVDNAINMYWRTAATSVATAQSLTLDFAFVSIRYIGPEKSITAAWTPTGSTLTNGTNSASNARFAIQDDLNYYTITANGTTGTDAYLSFTNVTIPTGANKMIVTVNARWSGASTSFELYARDFSGAVWRDITPHESSFTSSGTANTEQIYQFEIFDGYFSNGSNAAVSTPLSNFVSSSEVRIRVLSSSTTSNVGIDYAAVEFVKDPTYFASSFTNTDGGSVTNEYNDTFTDDNTTNFNVAANGSGIDFYFEFSGVITPPTGSNAVLVPLSSNTSVGTTTYNISIRNFTSGSWEQLNTNAMVRTTDGNDYFIKSIGTWSDYISSGAMRIRFDSNATAGSVTIDYLKIILGSVNSDSSGSSLDLGTTIANSQTQTRNLDTTQFIRYTDAWNIMPEVASPNRHIDAPASVALRIDFPLTVPTNSYPIAILYSFRLATGATTVTFTPTFKNAKNYYSDSITYAGSAAANAGEANVQAPLVGLTAAPSSTTTTTVAVATGTQTYREGWYNSFHIPTMSATDFTNLADVPNAIDTQTNEVTMRFRTSASTNLGTTLVDIDAAFIALRYVD